MRRKAESEMRDVLVEEEKKMAARHQHVQDSAVVERRLRPIYEWLDNNNSKKALQEAEKVLKKTPNLQCAKALKALALLLLGRDAECTQILNGLTAETPSDNATLQAMTICYRDLQQLEKVCSLYENAVKVDPSNEELHTHLFMSYVRTSNFKMQQTTAMALYKMIPKNPYYFWAVMSVVLQATRGPGSKDPAKRLVLMTLAERMVDKLITENRLEAEQEIQLYLMILELQEKNQQALATLDAPLGSKLMNGVIDNHRIPYLIKLEKWKDLNVLCKQLLTSSMDRWDIWKNYLVSMFKLYKTAASLNNHTENHNSDDVESGGPDDTPEKAHEFICGLIESIYDDNLFKSSSSYQLRGPYLARLELSAKIKESGADPFELLGDIFELFVEYFRMFGHKPCCVSDLRVYLGLLEAPRRLELSARLLKDAGISSTTLPQTEKQMQRHICSLQLSRLCGNHTDLDHAYMTALITALSLHYLNGSHTFGENRLSTDQGPADPYGLLAAHVLYDLAWTQSSSGPLMPALVLLEKLLSKSPSNFHAKLLCIRMYHVLGCGEGAKKIFDSLDTKHLQNDSLGFIHCARLQTTGLLSLAISQYDTTLKFFTTNYRDSIDHLTFSYKFGSFLKLEEFMDFRDRLNNSLHFTMTSVDRMILLMMQCATVKGLDNIEASPKNNNIDWDALRDNNDYNVYLSWDPERISVSLQDCKQVKSIFEQDKALARIRANLVWGISSAADVLKATDETREQCIKALPDIIRDWEQVFDEIDQKQFRPVIQNKISVPLPSRLHSHLALPYRRTFCSFFKLVHGLATENKDVCLTAMETASEGLGEVCDCLCKMVDQQNGADDNSWNKYASMEVAVNSVEIVSLSTLLCAICANIVKPAQTKKGKKKCSSDSELKELLARMLRNCKEAVVKIDKKLDEWQGPKNPCNLFDCVGVLAISDVECDSLLETLRSSHASAVKELKTVLNAKVKYLNSLIC